MEAKRLADQRQLEMERAAHATAMVSGSARKDGGRRAGSQAPTPRSARRKACASMQSASRPRTLRRYAPRSCTSSTTHARRRRPPLRLTSASSRRCPIAGSASSEIARRGPCSRGSQDRRCARRDPPHEERARRTRGEAYELARAARAAARRRAWCRGQRARRARRARAPAHRAEGGGRPNARRGRSASRRAGTPRRQDRHGPRGARPRGEAEPSWQLSVTPVPAPTPDGRAHGAAHEGAGACRCPAHVQDRRTFASRTRRTRTASSSIVQGEPEWRTMPSQKGELTLSLKGAALPHRLERTLDTGRVQGPGPLGVHVR